MVRFTGTAVHIQNFSVSPLLQAQELFGFINSALSGARVLWLLADHFFFWGDDLGFPVRIAFTPNGHMALLRQSPQRGETGRHRCCPKPTSSQLISVHRDSGSHDSRAFRVSSGVLVPFGPVHWSRLAIRWTCVSTPTERKIKSNGIACECRPPFTMPRRRKQYGQGTG